MSQSWFSFRNGAAAVQVFIYDEIGAYGVTAKAFVAELAKYRGRELLLRIHSPGGSIFEGTAIFNALKAHGSKITTQIDGLAASMATYVALAGSPIRAAENAFWMIHNPTGGVLGESKDMRQTADVLDKLRDTILAGYVAKTGKSEGDVKKMMDAETWMTAAEALEHGFIDAITQPVKAAATFDVSSFAHPPSAYAHRMKGRALLAFYNGLSPREKSEFLELHWEELEQAATVADKSVIRTPETSAEVKEARVLWDGYQGLSSPERAAFREGHEEELAHAAAILDRANPTP